MSLVRVAVAALFSLIATMPAFAEPARTWVDMPRALVVLKQSGPAAARAFADQLEAAGGHASVVYESGAAVVYADDAVLAQPALAGSIDQVFSTEIDGAALAALDARTGGVAGAWNFARTLDKPAASDAGVHA